MLLVDGKRYDDSLGCDILDPACIALIVIIDEEFQALSYLQDIPCFYYFACHGKAPPCLT